MDISDKRKTASVKNGKKGGRPIASKTLVTQMMKKVLIETINARFKPMLEAQIDSAIGVMLKKIDNKGIPYYVEEAPNTSAAKFLIEQVLGRAKESIEHSGEMKGLVGLITSLNNDSMRKDEE